MLKSFETFTETLKDSVFCKYCLKKLATVSSIALLLVSVFCLNCLADVVQQTDFNILLSDIDVTSGEVLLSNTNIIGYTLSNISESNTPGWPLGDKSFRSTFSVTSWDPPSDETYTVGTINYTFQVDISRYLFPADSRYLVFEVLGKLQSSPYTYPIEETSLNVKNNGVVTNLTYSEVINSGSGRSYIYIIDKLDLTDGKLEFTFNYGDFSASSLGTSILLFTQFSEFKVFSSMSAASAYTQEIKDILDGSPEQNAAASQYVDQAGQQAGQLEDLGDQLNSLDKPSPDQIGDLLDYDQYTGQGGLTGFGNIFKSTFIDNPLVTGMLFTSLSMALVSFIFFGKKA